jgi:phosphoglycerate dehydrogenase-like enzyme
MVGGAPLRELSETTVGLVGFGGIGREVARRVASLGARVIAVKRTPAKPGDANLTPVFGGGVLGDRIELLHGRAGLDVVLRESDVLVLCAPDTSHTRGILDREALGRLKDGALVVNVGRGKLIDEAALVEELSEGRLRGAGLDVFSKEPLPEGHPLWSLPNVLITPHVSAVTGGFWRRETALIEENVRHWLRGEPLLNVVDKEAGY